MNVHAIRCCPLTQKLEPPHRTILFLVILSQGAFYVLLIKYMFSWYIIGCRFASRYFNTKRLNQTVLSFSDQEKEKAVNVNNMWSCFLR